MDGSHEDGEPELPRIDNIVYSSIPDWCYDNRDRLWRRQGLRAEYPPGIRLHTTLVEDYNKITIDGDRRQFPEKQLM